MAEDDMIKLEPNVGVVTMSAVGVYGLIALLLFIFHQTNAQMGLTFDSLTSWPIVQKRSGLIGMQVFMLLICARLAFAPFENACIRLSAEGISRVHPFVRFLRWTEITRVAIHPDRDWLKIYAAHGKMFLNLEHLRYPTQAKAIILERIPDGATRATVRF